MLALVGQQKLEKRAKERAARIAAAEAAAHEGVVPEHEHVHEATADRAKRRRCAATLGTTDAAEAALSIEGVVAGYGDVEVLHGVDLRLDAGKVVALLGANGAGKSTCARSPPATVTPTSGTVTLEGTDITTPRRTSARRAGVLLVPEARGIFPGLTVEENLTVLLRSTSRARRRTSGSRSSPSGASRSAGLLSGGEQQMLSLAPALADPPEVLVADEPTLGLAPLAAEEVMRGDRRAAGRAAPRCCWSRSTRRTRSKVADTSRSWSWARSCGAAPSPRRTWSSWAPRTSVARAADVVDDGSGTPLPGRHGSHCGRRRAAASTARCSSTR